MLSRRLNPYAVDAYDGVNLNPLEVVFVKVKSFLLQGTWTSPVTSQTYDRWKSHEVSCYPWPPGDRELTLHSVNSLQISGHSKLGTIR